MKKFFLILSVASTVALSSCSITRPVDVTNNSLGTKKGESSRIGIFAMPVSGNITSAGLILTNSNYGIVEAAKKGGITKIGAVDLKQTNYVLFRKYTLIVSGE